MTCFDFCTWVRRQIWGWCVVHMAMCTTRSLNTSLKKRRFGGSILRRLGANSNGHGHNIHRCSHFLRARRPRKCHKCLKPKHRIRGGSYHDASFDTILPPSITKTMRVTCIILLPSLRVANAPKRRICWGFFLGEYNKMCNYPWPGALHLICILDWPCKALALGRPVF